MGPGEIRKFDRLAGVILQLEKRCLLTRAQHDSLPEGLVVIPL